MAPSIPIVAALLSASHVSKADDVSLLQMPVVEHNFEMDQEDCRCPGYYQEECEAEAAQGCVWSDAGSSNKHWCQCLGEDTRPPVDPVTLTLPPSVQEPRFIRVEGGTAIYWEVSGVKYWVSSCSLCDDSSSPRPCESWTSEPQSYIDGLATAGGYGSGDGSRFECPQHPLYAPVFPTTPPPTVAEVAVCPAGWLQVGDAGADIGGCGLQSCDARYETTSEAECAQSCDGRLGECVGFSYAPMNGDRNHESSTVCTLYSSESPTGTWTGSAGTVQVFCTREPARYAWQATGTLAQLEANIQEYPLTEWTYGVQYNHGWGDVHDVVINSWNRGIRVSATPFYPQGDNAQDLEFGTTVFTRDTDGQTPGQWIQNYYQDNVAVHSNGVADSIQVFRRRLPHAWEQVGTLAQLESEIAQYPLTEWTFGVQYNHGWGDVHDIVINSWNRGIRVSATPSYPQGDNAAALTFGTTVFTRDTDGQTPGQWIQNYYQRGEAVHSNGVADGISVFRQRLSTAWQSAGTLAQLEAQVSQYPFTEWTYGVQYNHGWGDVHDVVVNSWNRGIRVSATPFYPQGDNAQDLEFGTTVFTRDTDGQTPGQWIQNYYQDDVPVHSNGVADSIQVFRRRLPVAWQESGTLAQLESEIAQYPLTEWTFGVQYNHGWGDVHDIVINSWNRGIRVSVTPFYPQGDNAAALKFGTTVFTRDTDGQTPGEWIQNYYQSGDAVHSNGQSPNVQVFRHRVHG